MEDYYAYHLGIRKSEIKGSKIAILPGDPWRVNKIASEINEDFQELAFHREYKSDLVEFEKMQVLVISTGIGGPSTAIAIEELAQLGIEIFIRVGTCGSIRQECNAGDIIISKASVRLDGCSTHYAPIEYPAVADWELIHCLKKSAEELEIPHHVGLTLSSDSFYPGQERYGTYTGYVLKKFQNSIEEWRKLNIYNIEMESSTLFTLASVFGLKSAMIAGVIAQRLEKETVYMDKVEEVELKLGQMIRAALGKIKININF